MGVKVKQIGDGRLMLSYGEHKQVVVVCKEFCGWYRKIFRKEVNLSKVWHSIRSPGWLTWFIGERKIGMHTTQGVPLWRIIDFPWGMNEPGLDWSVIDDMECCDLIRLAMPGDVLEALVAEQLAGGAS